MLSAIEQGLGGVTGGFDRLQRTAERIARDGVGGDLAGNMVELIRARQQVRANLELIRTADDTIGSLLEKWI
jgi:hypothetical protein